MAQLVIRVDDHHGTTTENEGWTHENGVTDSLGNHDRLFGRDRGPGRCLLQAELIEKSGEKFAVLGEFDIFR